MKTDLKTVEAFKIMLPLASTLLPVASTTGQIVYQLRSESGSARSELERMVSTHGVRGAAQLLETHPQKIHRLCKRYGIRTGKQVISCRAVSYETFKKRSARGWDQAAASSTPPMTRTLACRVAAETRWDRASAIGRGSSQHSQPTGTKVPFFGRVSQGDGEVTR